MIYQREQLFEYFSAKEQEFLINLGTSVPENACQTKVRLFYLMMYYSFEIKNNMHSSILYYQKLKGSTEGMGPSEFPVRMPWVSIEFAIDEAKVSDYGGVKINKA